MKSLLQLILAACLGLSATAATEDAALAVLASDADVQKKAMACNDLALVGTAKAVPALAALLGDDKLASYARSGLEIIDDPSAGEALRAALPKLKGLMLAGVINSLGNRGDVAAVPALAKLATDPANGVADQALSALGRIATDDAVKVLVAVLKEGPKELKIPAAHAALVAAERMAAQQRSAAGLLAAVSAAEVPDCIKAAAAAK